MKLSDYAKKAGVSYQTAWRWWQKGHLSGYQLPSGTITAVFAAMGYILIPLNPP